MEGSSFVILNRKKKRFFLQYWEKKKINFCSLPYSRLVKGHNFDLGVLTIFCPHDHVMETLSHKTSIDNFKCALVEGKPINEIMRHACPILRAGKIPTDMIFSVLGEEYATLQKIKRALILPCNVECLQDSFVACGLAITMDKEFAGMLQSYYIYTMPSQAHVFRLSCLLEYPCAPVLLAREMHFYNGAEITSAQRRSYQRTAEWCLPGDIKLSGNKSSMQGLAEQLPFFTFILLVQMVLPRDDPDVALLHAQTPGAKQNLYTILQKILPLQLLLQHMKDMFYTFADVVTTIMSLPSTTSVTEWIKHTAHFYRQHPENASELYQIIHICVHAHYFVSDVPYNDILTCVGWFLRIDIFELDLEILNPFALEQLRFTQAEPDEADELRKHVAILLNGSPVTMAVELKAIFRDIGLPFSLLVNWYNKNGGCVFPAVLLQDILVLHQEANHPFKEYEQRLALITAHDRPDTTIGLGASVLHDLHDDVNLLLTFGPMLAFYEEEGENWGYYVPGVPMLGYAKTADGYYPALFCGFLLIYVRACSGYFDFFFLPEDFYRQEQTLTMENVLVHFPANGLTFAVTIGINNLTHCPSLLAYVLDVYLGVIGNKHATKMDAIQAFQHILCQYLRYIETDVIQNVELYLNDKAMAFFRQELQRMATKEVPSVSTDKLHALYAHASKSQQLVTTMANFIDQCEFISTDDQLHEITQLLEVVKNHPTL